MSAGGISYDCLRTARKVTLPSVEGWGTNMNILKDPPKSLFTKKIDKVGETQLFTNTLADSYDRICENISVYPRGVNPSVAVSYDNYGTNGGQNRQSVGPTDTSNITLAPGCSKGAIGSSGKLPYRIVEGGAFRPPLEQQFFNVPLSRQHRNYTEVFTNPAFPNYIKNLGCRDQNQMREVKKQF